MKEKRSFFERLTGTVRIDDELEPVQEEQEKVASTHLPIKSEWGEEENDGELNLYIKRTLYTNILKYRYK